MRRNTVEFCKTGQVLLCDFRGLAKGEMTKKDRPVIALNPSSDGLVTVVALSSTVPEKQNSPLYYQIPRSRLPKVQHMQKVDTWVKGGMIYRISLDRLSWLTDRKGHFWKEKIWPVELKKVQACVLQGLKLGHLSQYLDEGTG